MSTLWMLQQVTSFVLSSSSACSICCSEMSGRFSVNLLKTVFITDGKYFTPLNCVLTTGVSLLSVAWLICVPAFTRPFTQNYIFFCCVVGKFG